MVIEFTMEKRDFVELSKLAAVSKARLALLLLAYLVMGILVWTAVHFRLFDWKVAVVLTAILCASPILTIVRNRRQIVQQLEKTPFYAGQIRAEIDSTGIKMKYATGESFTEWSGHSDWKETGSLFVVYLGKNFMRAYPKRAFTAPELAKFRMLLEERAHGSK